MRRFRHGMFLITTLMLIGFLVMLATTLLVTCMTGNTTTTGYVNKGLAADAAVSGLNFVQAVLESNMKSLAPTPNGTSANLSILSSDNTVQVAVKGWNVVGWVSNTTTVGPGEQPLYLMFQACFNQDYSVYKASVTPPSLNGIQLPACPLVSVNNLNRLSQTPGTNLAQSYTASGAVHESVQGQRADVIVIGYLVTPDGTVLASRTVEGMLDVSQVGGFAGTAGMAKTGIDLIAGGTIDVGANGTAPAGFVGLSSFNGDITSQGTVAPVGGATAPPDYVSANKVALSAGSHFQYSDSGALTDYTASDSQIGAPVPPTVLPTDLPGLSNTVTVSAGTYVIWGTPAAVYHYPTDYAATNGGASPTAIPVQNQNWAQPDPTKPPTLNGVAPDAGPMQSLDSGGVIKFNPSAGAGSAGNSFTLTANDVSVSPINGVNSFTVVVAPVQTVPGGVNIVGSAAANGSAQLQFNPAVPGTQLQVRANGNVNIMGNVVGTGSVQAVGTDAVSGSPANINVLGKSTLDGRSDTGVALYSDGSTNVFGLVDASGNTVAQLPSSVTQYQTLLAANPQNVGGGGGGGGGISSLQQAEYSVMMQAISVVYGSPPNLSGGAPNPFGTACGNLANQNVTVQYNNQTYSGSLPQVLYQLENGLAPNAAVPGSWLNTGVGGGINNGNSNGPPTAGSIQDLLEHWTNTYNTNSDPTGTVAGWNFVNGGFGQVNVNMASADVTSYIQSGAPSGGGGGNGSPSPSPSGSGSGGPLPVFDQQFNGMVYAGGNFNFSTGANFTVNGALISNGGQLNLSANNITLNYDSALAGQFANLFAGGRVLLTRSSVTVY